MKKVIKENGERVDGLFRDSNGALVVNDPNSLAKYKRQLSREQEIKTLSEQVTNLTNIVQELMNKLERK